MTVAQSEWQFDRFASAAGCSNTTNQLACLRAADITTLEAANVALSRGSQGATVLLYSCHRRRLDPGPSLQAFQRREIHQRAFDDGR